jgi:hypothetical protein
MKIPCQANGPLCLNARSDRFEPRRLFEHDCLDTSLVQCESRDEASDARSCDDDPGHRRIARKSLTAPLLPSNADEGDTRLCGFGVPV